MKLFTMEALTSFSHKGTVVGAGDLLEVSAVEAAALNYQQRAAFTDKRIQAKVMEAEPESPAESTPSTATPTTRRQRRQYRRRDMVAEK